MTERIDRTPAVVDVTAFRWAPLLAVCAGYFMVILDLTMINVAVPQIGQEFSASFTQIQWITDGYTLVFAAALLAGGMLGDRMGNRRVFLFGTVVFTLASALACVAWDPLSLIAIRLVEGAGAALIVPGSLALLTENYPSAQHRSRAFGIWAALAGTAACAGPVLGGLLTGTVGWRWVFLINVPIGICCFIASLRFVARSPRRRGGHMDWPAQVLAAAAVAFLIAGLNQAGDSGWGSLPVITPLCLSAAAILGFILRERSTSHPVLPLAFLAEPGIRVPATLGMLSNFAFYGMVFTASFSFESQLDASPTITGIALLPAMLMTVVASILSSIAARRYSIHWRLTVGFLTGAAGLSIWAFTGSGVDYLILVVPMMATGFGTSFILPAATSVIMAAAPDRFSGTASAFFNTTRQLGAAAGVAVGGSLLATLHVEDGTRASMLCGAIAFLLAAGIAQIRPRDSAGAGAGAGAGAETTIRKPNTLPD